MKRRLIVLTLIISLVVAFGWIKSDATAKEKKFITLAGGPSGGTFFAMVTGISKIINENAKWLDCTPATGGAVMNTRKVGTKKIEFGLATTDTAYHAVHGGPEFKDERYPDIRVVYSGHVSHWHMATLEKSGIKTIEDLRGKRVAIGYPGGSVETVTREILKEHGLIPDKDFKKFYFRHTGVVNGLKDGTIDAGAILTGAPSGALLDLATTHKMVLLPISPAMKDKIAGKFPYYFKDFYEPGIYPGLKERVPTLTIGTYMLTHKDTDDTLVYTIAKLISENTASIGEVHPAGKQWGLETVKKGISITIHPGALKYFKEVGISF